MRQFLFTPAVLGLATVLLAQGSAPPDSKPKQNPEALCTVTGLVVAAADGNPLKSARVVLVDEDAKSHDQMYAASSDSDGHFVLKDIPPGRYKFFASHTGFVEQHYKAGTNNEGPLFSLKAGEKVGDILFRLIAAAVITGRISNEDGDPMQDIEVVAVRRPTEEETEDEDAPAQHKIQTEPVASAESDDRGQYRIFGLKPGEYFVRAEDTAEPHNGVQVDSSFWAKRELGSDIASVYFPGVAQLSQAQVVPLKAGEEAQADITMRRVKTLEISGRVVGAKGPAARTMVRLEPADFGQSDFGRDDTTDDKGNFRFRNVPEGTYYILAYQRDPGSRVYESRVRQKVEVGEDNIEALTVSLVNGGATIQGRVKVDGSSSIVLDRIGLALSPTDENGDLGAYCEVKKDGSFELKSVHDGSYAIRVLGLENDGFVKAARRGPDDLFEKGVQVEGGASGRIDLTVSSEGAQLEGSVTDGDGPVIGARVRLVPDPLTPYNHLRIHRTNTDQLGQFSLKDIAPGKYKVTAKRMLTSEEATNKSDPQAIRLSESEHKKIQIELEKPQQP
jgi:hypothetical protein